MSDEMTKAERLELAKIVRQRGKLSKDDVDTQKATILADAEAALSRKFDEQDAAWSELTADARRYMAEVQEKLTARCEALGIPVEFRPSYGLAWFSRGSNADPRRRAELRTAVKAQAEASARAAKLAIDRQCVQIQEQIMVGGFESTAAREFIESLPTAEELMPALRLPELGAGTARESGQ